MKKIIFFITIAIILSTAAAWAKDDPYTPLLKDVLSYFPAIKGSVVSVQDSHVTSDIADSLKPGMRLQVLRKAGVYSHPVTAKELGASEQSVGLVEVSEDGGLALIGGEAQAGDTLMISSKRIPMLFYQGETLGWTLSEEYYFRLKDSGRFVMIDAPPGNNTVSEVLDIARSHNAEIVLYLTAQDVNGVNMIHQRLLWVDSATVVSEATVNLDVQRVDALSLGDEFFLPDPNEPVHSIKLPYDVTLLNVADYNADGTAEVAVGSGGSIYFFSYSGILSPAYGEEKSKITLESGEAVWMDSIDADGDGRVELIATVIKESRPISYIYSYEKREFVLKATAPVFLRAIGNELYGQASGLNGGYNGPVMPMVLDSGAIVSKGSPMMLPEGMGLYNFVPMTGDDGRAYTAAYDEKGYMVLYDGAGAGIWRSQDNYGRYTLRYSYGTLASELDASPLYISARMKAFGSGALLVTGIPVTQGFVGLKATDTMVSSIYVRGGEVVSVPRTKKSEEMMLDIAYKGEALFILLRSYGIEPGNVLEGKKPFRTYLEIYTLKGQ